MGCGLRERLGEGSSGRDRLPRVHEVAAHAATQAEPSSPPPSLPTPALLGSTQAVGGAGDAVAAFGGEDGPSNSWGCGSIRTTRTSIPSNSMVLETRLNSFVLTSKRWISATNAGARERSSTI